MGPLADLKWPANSVPVDSLLHDDGQKLWSVTLSGERKLLWEHPKAVVHQITAGPDGKRLAYSVELKPEQMKDPASVLYLLEENGSIRTVDISHRFQLIEGMVFLRPSRTPQVPDRLYWVRVGDEIVKKTHSLDTQPMVLGNAGAQPVNIALRNDEAVFDLHGYPGENLFTLALFRRVDSPTRLEILHNTSFHKDETLPIDSWPHIEHRANTDTFIGVAWVSPIDYVIPVVNENWPTDYSLRMFRWGCEFAGSHMLYQGDLIDFGYSEAPWKILRGGSDRVLVLANAAMKDIAEEKAKQAPWLSVEIPSGKITETKAMWEQGAWTWVSPRAETRVATDKECSELKAEP